MRWPRADRAKLHDNVDIFGNARVTSEIRLWHVDHMPITWRVLTVNYQT